MRMTNEEFQAEVFRRSRVYLAERQTRRRRLFAGVLAFAGCFAVVIAAAKLRPLTAKNEAGLTADNAMQADYASKADMAEEAYEAEYSEEACAEMNDEKDITQGITFDSAKSGEAKADEAPAEDYKEENEAEQAGAAPEASSDAERPESALFDDYGIKGMPETLAGMTYAGAENRNRQKNDQTGADALGGAAEDGDIFRYQDAAGGQPLYVRIQTMESVGAEHPQPENMTMLFAEDADTKKAIFRTETLYVTVYADNLPLDTLKQAAQEMKDYLSQ